MNMEKSGTFPEFQTLAEQLAALPIGGNAAVNSRHSSDPVGVELDKSVLSSPRHTWHLKSLTL